MDNTDNFIIETVDLKKVFISNVKGKRNEVAAVKGVNLKVRRGEIFGFLGPNGAGKSTTQRMLSTLLTPTSGTVRIVGYNLAEHQEAVRKNIGYVSQAGGSDLSASGYENLVLQARLYGIDEATAEQHARELIKHFQMESFADRSAGTYSGGQRRRLDVALGMTHKPQLLLLDEPTTGLDPQSRAYMWKEIKKLKAEGMTIFLTTHYMEEADQLCDTIAIIDNGAIVANGTPIELKNSIGADTIVLGFPSDQTAQQSELILREKFSHAKFQRETRTLHIRLENGDRAIPEILRLLDAHKFHAESITLAKPSLDDVFLKYTGRSLRENK